MRVISQDGTIDVPYEISSFSMAVGEYDGVEHAAIYCYNSSMTAAKMAEYNSEEKAKKAMELLRTAYTGRFITNAEVSQDFEKEMKELMKGGFGTVIVKDSCDRVEFNNLNGYFQFLTEEELE